MQDDFITSFLVTFFTENHCTVEQQQGVLHIKLTEEMDKALMNRPFYWHYMESMNQAGKPMTISLITDPEKRDEKGEWIQFGTARLRQMEMFLKKQAQFTMLFQKKWTEEKTMLQPWLLINYKIALTGKQKKEMMISYGLNLINGMMTFNMMDRLQQIDLEQVISDCCYTVSPLITIKSGFLRIEKNVDNYLEQLDHSWAIESMKLLEEELVMLHHFYLEEHAENSKENELASLKERFTPVIHHEIINGGLVYLEEGIFTL